MLLENIFCFFSAALRNGSRYIFPITYIRTNNVIQRINKASLSSEPKVERDVKVSVVTNEQEDHQYEEDVKTKILESALQFVTKTGWSLESITAGAESAGYPGITHGLFRNGGGDLVHYFNMKCNEELVSLMKNVSTSYYNV